MAVETDTFAKTVSMEISLAEWMASTSHIPWRKWLFNAAVSQTQFTIVIDSDTANINSRRIIAHVTFFDSSLYTEFCLKWL